MFLQSLSINEFLKPAAGEKQYNSGGRGRGRGGARGGGGGGRYNQGGASNYALLKLRKLKTRVTFLLWVASESLFLAFLLCHHLFSTFRMAEAYWNNGNVLCILKRLRSVHFLYFSMCSLYL